MNREAFYLEIGNIDDDLILEASKESGHKTQRINIFRIAGMAACLCLVCTALFWVLHRDVVYFNVADAPIASKLVTPADEDTTIITLTYQELFDYYGLEQLPDMLANLSRVEIADYFIYQDSESIIYDTNILQYKSADSEQTLSILIAKEDSDYSVFEEEARQSRIDGVSLVLARAEGQASVYWAEVCNQGIYLRIVAHGMDEASFTDIIRELIKSQK